MNYCVICQQTLIYEGICYKCSASVQLVKELTEMIDKVATAPASGRQEYARNFIRSAVKEKLSQYSQQEPTCPRGTCLGCPDEAVCEDFGVKDFPEAFTDEYYSSH